MNFSIKNQYDNAIKLTQYRKWLKLEDRLNNEELQRDLLKYDYCTVKGIDKNNIKSIIIITNINTEIANRIAHVLKIIKSNNEFYNFMFISDKLIKTASLLSKKNESFTKHVKSIETYTYSLLIFELPKHILVPKHRIMSLEDVANIKTLNNIHVNDLPSILLSDPQCIWLGARKNDIIEITRNSGEIAGINLSYRIVI